MSDAPVSKSAKELVRRGPTRINEVRRGADTAEKHCASMLAADAGGAKGVAAGETGVGAECASLTR